MEAPEVRIITEAIQIILRDRDINKFDAGLLRFHQKSIAEIMDKLKKDDEFLKNWNDE